MNQIPKRVNPFDRLQKQQNEEEVVETAKQEDLVKDEVEEIKTPEIEEPKPVKVVKVAPKAKTPVVETEDREKFTSTMETSLRRRIKIVCATRGIMFSQFIEDACREKLRREGER